MQDVQGRIAKVLEEAQNLNKHPDRHPMLPYAIEWLQGIQKRLTEKRVDSEILVREASSLYRYVTDDGIFMQSAIGQELLQLSGELISFSSQDLAPVRL